MDISDERWDELHQVYRAIPDEFILVPPDGGDVKSYEAIQKMADEIERLRNVVENWRELVGAKVFNEEIIKMKNDEIERLREALKTIAKFSEGWGAFAEAALQQKETE